MITWTQLRPATTQSGADARSIAESGASLGRLTLRSIYGPQLSEGSHSRGVTVSFMVTVPELVTTAAANLAGIGSTLQEATAAATGPTTAVAAAAADEVSAAISELFGSFGQEFQAVNSQG